MRWAVEFENDGIGKTARGGWKAARWRPVDAAALDATATLRERFFHLALPGLRYPVCDERA